jgi:PAS domain S-box-containing protein
VKAEAQRRLQEAALQAAGNSVVITDREGRIVWVNPAFTRLTGYTLEEVQGRTPRVLKSDAQEPAFYRQLWQTILAGQVWHGELINRRKDGTRYIEDQTIAPVRSAEGAITHFVAIKQDVTDRRQREQELEAIAAVSAALAAGGSRHDMAAAVLNRLLTLLQAGGALLATREAADEAVTCELGVGSWAQASGSPLPDGSLPERVIASGQAEIAPAEAEAEVVPGPEAQPAVAAVPLSAQGQVIGALAVTRHGAFGPAARRVLEAVANIAASALHRAALLEQT